MFDRHTLRTSYSTIGDTRIIGPMTHKTTFTRPAVQILQGNLTLYLTYITPSDLFSEGFYSVDKLESRQKGGFQRILNETRARRLSRHLTEAHDKGYAHLPTTIFLATDESVDFDSESNTLTFDRHLVCPFSVVDGQHRIEGLRQAVRSEPALSDFQLPVTIATELDTKNQMYHFFIVNTTQVPVESSLRQQITSRFTEMQGIDDLPYTPHWLRREISVGKDRMALRMVEFLNEESSSPLHERIQMANDPVSRGKIKQSSIVNVMRKEIFTPGNPLSARETDQDRQNRIMLNYVRAVDRLFVDGRDRGRTVVYKSNGIFLFFSISKWVFGVIYSSTRDFTVSSIASTISSGLREINDAYRDMGDPDWWMPGPRGASVLNRALASRYVDAFQQALARSHEADDIIL